MKNRLRFLTALAVAGVAAAALAQRRWGGGGDRFPDSLRTAREVETNSTGTPEWEYPAPFQTDVFTFARIRYENGGFGGRGGWATDLPDSDLNLSWRLQQMTSMKVDPNARIIRPTHPEDYPFVYIAEPGGLSFSDADAQAMRKYLLNGGFLLLEDFWGENEWENCAMELKRVFPEREFTDIPLEHPLYHCVFEIKSKAQVPSINLGVQSEFDGRTWEREDAQEVHHRGIFDDKGRLMVMATHNTDNGDGWEREGESAYYFKEFSEKTAYPLAVNIIFYVMTH